MLQVKDPAIKLFGKTIPFSDKPLVADPYELGTSSDSGGGSCTSNGSEIGVDNKVAEVRKIVKQGEESMDGSIMCEGTEKEKEMIVNEETENGNEGNLKEKANLKKPDKVLPCPRCNSMDTKFCYYNNYNVLQPRHFCKGCQRYWTAGGAMRNVPVGAGKRKSKNVGFQNRYLTISEVLQASCAGSPNGFAPCPPGLTSGSVLLTAGSDATVAGSVSNVLQIPFLDQASNLTCKVSQVLVTKSRTVGEVNSSRSSITASNETESIQNGRTPLAPNSLAQIPCVPTWPHSWNAALPPPAFVHPGFSLPFVPPTYWPCAAAIPNTWNAPWLQSPSQTVTNSRPPVLGKHSRDEAIPPMNKSDKPETPKQPTILTPKALRIVHPEEAAKSSIWETLGIKNETISKGGLFRNLKSKEADNIKYLHENYAHMTSNPAALSRSLNFQEVS